jgi:hypothetical protein
MQRAIATAFHQTQFVNPTQSSCHSFKCFSQNIGRLFQGSLCTYTSNIPLDNPTIFNLASNVKFPVYVKLNWQNVKSDLCVLEISTSIETLKQVMISHPNLRNRASLIFISALH